MLASMRPLQIVGHRAVVQLVPLLIPILEANSYIYFEN